MAMGIKLDGAYLGGARNNSLILPDLTALLYEGIFHTSDVRALRNVANLSAPATKVGTPTYDEGSMWVSAGSTFGSNGVTFPKPVTDAFSCIAVVTAVSMSTGGNGLGYYLGFPGMGLAYGLRTAGQFQMSGGTGASTSTATLPGASFPNFVFLAGSVGGGILTDLWASDGSGGLAHAQSSTALASTGGGTLSVGTTASGANGQLRTAYAAAFTRRIAVDEVNEIFANVKELIGAQLSKSGHRIR